MTDPAPIDFNQPQDKIIAALAEGKPMVIKVLTRVAQKMLQEKRPLLPIFYDLDDMHMRGTQIVEAIIFSHATHAAGDGLVEFIRNVTARDQRMVDWVNQTVPDRKARAQGAQPRMSQVDFAVQSAVAASGNAAVTRMDEGAEHVHNFFLAMLKTMQATGQFTTNLRINLGLESGHCMVFAITAVELLDKDGKPVEKQPTKEGERIEEQLHAMAATATDVAKENSEALRSAVNPEEEEAEHEALLSEEDRRENERRSYKA